MNGDITV